MTCRRTKIVSKEHGDFKIIGINQCSFCSPNYSMCTIICEYICKELKGVTCKILSFQHKFKL